MNYSTRPAESLVKLLSTLAQISREEMLLKAKWNIFGFRFRD